MIPSSIFVEAREALQMTRERFGCGGDEAAAYLEGLIAGGELDPDWPKESPTPPVPTIGLPAPSGAP